jgi:hypothetical protein
MLRRLRDWVANDETVYDHFLDWLYWGHSDGAGTQAATVSHANSFREMVQERTQSKFYAHRETPSEDAFAAALRGSQVAVDEALRFGQWRVPMVLE